MRLTRFCILAALLIALLAGCTAQTGPSAVESPGDGLLSFTAILGGRHSFESGVRLAGDVYVFQGEAHVTRGAAVSGSMLITGGEVLLDGVVEGDITLAGGTLELGPSAEVAGVLTVAGGALERAPAAIVAGGVTSRPAAMDRATEAADLGSRLLSSVVSALLVAILTYLLARYLPRPLARVSGALADHWPVSLAMGLLAGCIALVMLVLVAFTILLIPVSVVGAVALALAVVYGWAAWGALIGGLLVRRLAKSLDAPLAAAGGAAVFMLASSLVQLIPFAGGILPLLAAAAGFGAVLLTRFGVYTFVPAAGETGLPLAGEG